MTIQGERKLIYETALFFWRIVVQIFFREIRPRGAFNIPSQGPVIFVAAPHSNQFLDPLLLAQEVWKERRRTVQFLAAAKSMQRKYVGFLIRLMSSIPVARAADDAKPGKGRIRLSEDDPCVVLGEGTSFTSDFTPKMQIMLPKSIGSAVAEVVEVISDTELKIKREFGGESGKGTTKIKEKLAELKAQGLNGLEYKKLPYVDQQEMYRHVYSCLRDGGAIGIFPEGGSHDRTDLLPLKAGVSMMALGAMANDPTVKVKIVPVGLSYFHAHRFRSRGVVEFGAAMDVPQRYVDMFKQGGQQKREAVAKFLDLVYNGLKTVTVRAPDYDTLMLIQAVRRLYRTPDQHLSLGQVVELNRRLLEGYTHFKDEPRVQALRENVLKYNRKLRDLGLRDHQVPRAQKASWKTLSLLFYRVGLLLVWTILALPGTILNGPMFILAAVISRKKAKEALAASVVKVAAKDVIGTWKVLISLGVAPVLYGFYAFLATLLAIEAGASLKWKIWTPCLVILALPFMNYAALKFGEAGFDVLKSLPPLIVALLPGQSNSLEKLKAMRVELSNEVVSLINEYGPQLYDDFEEWRMVAPSASVPASGGRSGIWRRKTSNGTIDAQGNLLIHPMAWLDERLFGWSHSAKFGRSAWSGNVPSRDISAMATPEVSDDEDDTGDYDDVIGWIPAHGGSTHGGGDLLGQLNQQGKSRSRNGSWADLQRLRHAGGADGHLYSTPHQRKPSLSDNVHVDRIAAEDQEKLFTDATHHINAEMKQRKALNKDQAD